MTSTEETATDGINAKRGFWDTVMNKSETEGFQLLKSQEVESAALVPAATVIDEATLEAVRHDQVLLGSQTLVSLSHSKTIHQSKKDSIPFMKPEIIGFEPHLVSENQLEQSYGHMEQKQSESATNSEQQAYQQDPNLTGLDLLLQTSSSLSISKNARDSRPSLLHSGPTRSKKERICDSCMASYSSGNWYGIFNCTSLSDFLMLKYSSK